MLGHPGYYVRFGFRRSDELGLEPPQPAWHAAFLVGAARGVRPVAPRADRLPAQLRARASYDRFRWNGVARQAAHCQYQAGGCFGAVAGRLPLCVCCHV